VELLALALLVFLVIAVVTRRWTARRG